MIKNILGKGSLAKKALAIFVTFSLLGIFSISYSSSMLGTIETENITVASGEAIVFSYAKKIDTISFSKDSGFTIRTLEGSVWKDVGSDITEFSPMRGYVVRNFSQGDLTINATYKNVTLAEDAVFNRVLKAGWNLVGLASNNSYYGIIGASDGFGDLLYSEVVDFTDNGFSDNSLYNISINHDVLDGNYTTRTKESLSGSILNEKLAYGVLVDSDLALSGSQVINSDEEIIIRSELTTSINYSLISSTTGSIALSWLEAPNSVLYDTEILGYNLYYGTGSDIDAILNAIQLGGLIEGTGAIITNLSENTQYTFSSKAVHLMDGNIYEVSSYNSDIFKTKGRPVMGDVVDTVVSSGVLVNIDVSSYVTESDGDLVSYTLTGDTLPVGLLFNTGSGLLSGTPTSTGSYNFSVYATDIDGISNIDNFSLDVVVTPIISQVPDFIFLSGTLVNEDLSVYLTSDLDPILGYDLWDFTPPGLLFNTGSGLLSGTPTSTGSYNNGLYAWDKDGLSNTSWFNIIIKSAPQVLNISNFIFNSGSLVNEDLSIYVTDPDGDAILSYTLTGETLPSGLSFDSNTGLLNGNTTATGVYNLGLYVTDVDGDSNIGNFTITINP